MENHLLNKRLLEQNWGYFYYWKSFIAQKNASVKKKLNFTARLKNLLTKLCFTTYIYFLILYLCLYFIKKYFVLVKKMYLNCKLAVKLLIFYVTKGDIINSKEELQILLVVNSVYTFNHRLNRWAKIKQMGKQRS